MMNSELTLRIPPLVSRLEGWCSVEKALTMARCVCESRPRCCVELGVFGGRSLLPLALACQSLGTGRVFGIDPWSAASALEGLQHPEDIAYWTKIDYEAIYRGCQQAIIEEDLASHCTLIRIPAQQCAELFTQIDLLHIDGNHHRESALRDVRNYLPRVAPGGDIWFDDSNWESTQDAVQLLREACDIVQDYGGYLHLRKRPTAVSTISMATPVKRQAVSHTVAASGPSRTMLLRSTDPRLGLFRGGIYNPGAVLLGDHVLLIARNERHTELDRRSRPELWKGSCRPVALTVDRQGQVKTITPLSLPPSVRDERVEDFRLFRDGTELYASFSRVLTLECIRNQVARIDLEQLELGTPQQPQVDFSLRPIEKNWCYFEHQQRLKVLYSFQPFRVLALVDRAEFHFCTALSSPLQFFGQPHPLRGVPQVSFSTAPVKFRGDLLIFIHWRDGGNNYVHYAVLLDADTLRPKRISSRPLFSGGDALGLRPNVLYLMSVVALDANYWFYFGEGDEHLACAMLSTRQLEDFLTDAIDIGLDESSAAEIVGDYVYEHQGLYQRTVTLNPDGLIDNGGDHDRRWRVEQFGPQKELWILGDGGISCRLLPEGTSRWIGVWNRGTRPVVTLSKVSTTNP